MRSYLASDGSVRSEERRNLISLMQAPRTQNIAGRGPGKCQVLYR